MKGTINGVPATFLVDTGAAVTLLQQDTWMRIIAHHPQHLSRWSEQRLVGVDGSSLTIHGSAQVDVKLNGKELSANIVVVIPVTVEAILGIDFLKNYNALIDLVKESLHLSSDGGMIHLQEPSGSSPSD